MTEGQIKTGTVYEGHNGALRKVLSIHDENVYWRRVGNASGGMQTMTLRRFAKWAKRKWPYAAEN